MRNSHPGRAGTCLMVIACAALPAVAEPLPSFFQAEGQLRAGVAGAPGQAFLSGDADVSLHPGAGFSLSLGLYGAATDLTGAVDTPHETYGTLGWEGGGYRLDLGVPRPAYDSVALSYLDQLDPLRAVTPDRMGSSRSRATWGAIHDGGLPLGLRLAGGGQGYSWAVSAHEMGEVRLAGFGLSYDSGSELQLALAAELASDGSGGLKATASRALGAVTLGGGLFHATRPASPDLAEAWLAWQASDALGLHLLLQAPDQGPGAAVLGVGAGLPHGAALQAAVRLEGDQASALLTYGIRFAR